MESDAESSDSSMDDIDSEKELAKISAYRKQLEENKLDYDAHLGLIQSLRAMGEMEELRKARKAMNEVYPLAPDIWLDWLSDEQKICASEEEKEFIHELFKKAVKEYMNVQIWVEFIMFMLGRGEIEATRQVCDDALTAVGIHLAEGILVWQAVLLVEQQLLLGIAADNTKEIEAQKKRIQGIIRRQARVPLMNLNKEEFLDEAKKWFDEVDPQIVRDLNSSYAKMMEKMPLEEALLRASDETEKLEAYRKYIDFVRRSDNPAVIQNVYERTVTALCLNPGMWEEYVRFVMDQFSSADYVILPVCERSQANCPWSSILFELHITALQMFSHTHPEGETKMKIRAVLESTLEKNALTELEAVRVWMSFLIYLRRLFEWDDEAVVVAQLTEFQDAIDDALAFLKRYGDDVDKDCTILRFQAKILAESARDIEEARLIWNNCILKRHNNFKSAALWLEFINLERSYGDQKHCRKLYRRALERVWEDVEVIGSSFLQFEQEVGTLATMMDFEKRYRDRMSIVQRKRMEDAIKEEARVGKGKGKVKVEVEVKKQQKVSPLTSQPSSKEKSGPDLSPSMTPKGTKRSSSSLDVTPPPGYKASPEDSQTPSKKQKVENHGEFVSHDSALDYRTVFLSNMDYNASQEDVLAVFTDCGEVDNFRLVKDFRGRSKGFGYLVFKDAASVAPALNKDRTPVGQRPLFVSRCNPKEREVGFKFANTIEKEKLFVRGLPFSMNEEDVRKEFEPHGEIKSIRLVTHRNGFPKGTCYIEYHDAPTADAVQQKMDGAVLKEHKITVVISDPSKSKVKKEKISDSVPTQRKAPPKGSRLTTQKAKLDFVPRALIRNLPSNLGSHQNGASGSSASANENGGSDTKPKSNEEFRKMLLG